MSMWDEAEKAANEASSGGTFFRLQDDGDSAVVAFVGDPQPCKVVWNGEGYEDFDPARHTDKKPSVRIKFNVFNSTDSAMQIWEMNAATFKALCKLRVKYGLDKKTFEVTRNGRKGDTKTTYQMLPEGDIDKALAKKIENTELHDLTGKRQDKAGSGNRELLTSILKTLDKTKLAGFLAELGVAKVSDISDGDVLRALELANMLKRSPAPSSNEEIDPFA